MKNNAPRYLLTEFSQADLRKDGVITQAEYEALSAAQ